MTEQYQDTPKPESPQGTYDPKYKGPKKLDKARELLKGVEGLIAKENLADSYRQSGGQ